MMILTLPLKIITCMIKVLLGSMPRTTSLYRKARTLLKTTMINPTDVWDRFTVLGFIDPKVNDNFCTQIERYSHHNLI